MEKYQAKSLPALAVFVHPLDLRLGLLLGYEHSRHAWLGRFAQNTEMHFPSLHGGLIFRWVCTELGLRGLPALYTYSMSSLPALALCCRTTLLASHDEGVSERASKLFFLSSAFFHISLFCSNFVLTTAGRGISVWYEACLCHFSFPPIGADQAINVLIKGLRQLITGHSTYIAALVPLFNKQYVIFKLALSHYNKNCKCISALFYVQRLGWCYWCLQHEKT